MGHKDWVGIHDEPSGKAKCTPKNERLFGDYNLDRGRKYPPKITSRGLRNNETPIMVIITSWVEGLKLPFTVVDTGASMNTVDKAFVDRLPSYRVCTGDGATISVGDGSLLTRKDYVYLPINIAGVEKITKCYIQEKTPFDLLLGTATITGGNRPEESEDVHHRSGWKSP